MALYFPASSGTLDDVYQGFDMSFFTPDLRYQKGVAMGYLGDHGFLDCHKCAVRVRHPGSMFTSGETLEPSFDWKVLA